MRGQSCGKEKKSSSSRGGSGSCTEDNTANHLYLSEALVVLPCIFLEVLTRPWRNTGDVAGTFTKDLDAIGETSRGKEKRTQNKWQVSKRPVHTSPKYLQVLCGGVLKLKQTLIHSLTINWKTSLLKSLKIPMNKQCKNNPGICYFKFSQGLMFN